MEYLFDGDIQLIEYLLIAIQFVEPWHRNILGTKIYGKQAFLIRKYRKRYFLIKNLSPKRILMSEKTNYTPWIACNSRGVVAMGFNNKKPVRPLSSKYERGGGRVFCCWDPRLLKRNI